MLERGQRHIYSSRGAAMKNENVLVYHFLWQEVSYETDAGTHLMAPVNLRGE